MRQPVQIVVLLLVGTIATALHAQGTVIYRCTSAGGEVTMQNDVPCARGMKQELRTVGTLPSLPPPSRAAPPPMASTPPLGAFELVVGPQSAELPASAVPESEREPPPALFQCMTWDQDTYFSEDGEPEPECAPLTTVGIGGNPNIGAGAACEMRRSECTPVAGDALCAGWRRRVGEAEFRAKYANQDADDPRKLEYARVVQLLADSNCPR